MMPPQKLEGNLPLLPAVCFRCKGHRKSYFIDTGMDTEFDGRIYICHHCMTDFANADPNLYTQREVTLMELEKEKVEEVFSKALRRYDHLIKGLKGLKLDIEDIIRREEKAAKLEREKEKRAARRERELVESNRGSAGNDPESDSSSPRVESEHPAIELDLGQPDEKAGTNLLLPGFSLFDGPVRGT